MLLLGIEHRKVWRCCPRDLSVCLQCSQPATTVFCTHCLHCHNNLSLCHCLSPALSVSQCSCLSPVCPAHFSSHSSSVSMLIKLLSAKTSQLALFLYHSWPQLSSWTRPCTLATADTVNTTCQRTDRRTDCDKLVPWCCVKVLTRSAVFPCRWQCQWARLIHCILVGSYASLVSVIRCNSAKNSVIAISVCPKMPSGQIKKSLKFNLFLQFELKFLPEALGFPSCSAGITSVMGNSFLRFPIPETVPVRK